MVCVCDLENVSLSKYASDLVVIIDASISELKWIHSKHIRSMLQNRSYLQLLEKRLC